MSGGAALSLTPGAVSGEVGCQGPTPDQGVTRAERAWNIYVNGIGALAYGARWIALSDQHKATWQAVVDAVRGAEAAE